MLQPQAVIFDIGRVLVEWQPERHYAARFGAARADAFFREVPIHDANLAIDGGAPFRATLTGLAASHPDWRAEIMAWADDWLHLIGAPIAGSVRLMAALRRRGVPVMALTNFGAETWEIALAQDRFAFLHQFDRAYVSGHMRLLKPDPAIYAAVEQDCGLAPGALFFTDDRPENIAAAAARGWQTHLFTAAGALGARLVAAGLLAPEDAE